MVHLVVALLFCLAGPALADDTEPASAPPPTSFEKRPVNPGNVLFVPGKGLRVTSNDDAFSLTLGLRVQMRVALDVGRDEDGTVLAPKTGLSIPRARVTLSGHLFGEHNEYKLQISFSPHDNGIRDSLSGDGPVFTPMRDAYLDFTYLRDLEVRVGQFKVPFSRERMISSSSLQMVDRSLANAEFNLDRSIGVAIASEDFLGVERLRYMIGVFSPRGRGAAGLDDLAFVYAGRIEVLPLGLFKSNSEGDLERRKNPGLALSIAYAFADDAYFQRVTRGAVPDDGGTSDIHQLAGDVVLHWAGLSVASDWYFRTSTRDPGPLADEEAPKDGWGTRAQVGYVLPPAPVELALRYSTIQPTNAHATSLARGNEAGAAVSWYIARHSFKLQADYTYAWVEDLLEPTHAVQVQVQAAL